MLLCPSLFFPDFSEKKSDLRVCDDSTCRYGGTCVEDGADLKCVCNNFQVALWGLTLGRRGRNHINATTKTVILFMWGCKDRPSSVNCLEDEGPCVFHPSGNVPSLSDWQLSYIFEAVWTWFHSQTACQMSCRLTIKGYLLFGKEVMQLCYVSVCCNSPGASNITQKKTKKKLV